MMNSLELWRQISYSCATKFCQTNPWFKATLHSALFNKTRQSCVVDSAVWPKPITFYIILWHDGWRNTDAREKVAWNFFIVFAFSFSRDLEAE